MDSQEREPLCLYILATVDKFIQTLELVAMNSQSLKAKNAQDFVLAAKISLPDATVDKIVEKAKEEALKK